MVIRSATFVKSSTQNDQLPPEKLPEHAFVGRSNVGKSSLINYLLSRKSLAKTSSTPGKTQTINHFLINEDWYLVDLPGYGYARTSQKNRKSFADMIDNYLTQRSNLMNIYVLVDSRHKAQKLDLDFMYRLGENGLPFTLVFTKIDKLNSYEWEANRKAYEAVLLETWEELPPMIATSSTRDTGREELLAHIDEINGYFKK